MKFATLFALVATASAIKLKQPKTFKLVQVHTKDEECPTQAQFDEVAKWVHNELTTGKKTITAAEAEKGARAFAKKHGIEITPEMEEQAVAAFTHTDSNGDGELDLAEMGAAWEAHDGDAAMEACGLSWPEGTFE